MTDDEKIERMRSELYCRLRDETLKPWIRSLRHSCATEHYDDACPVAIAAMVALEQLAVVHATRIMQWDEETYLDHAKQLYRLISPLVRADEEAAGVARPVSKFDIN